MAEELVRRAVTAFMGRDLDGILAVADDQIVLRSHGGGTAALPRPRGGARWFEAVFGVFPDWNPQPRPTAHEEDGAVVIGLDVTETGAGSGVPIDQTYWLGAKVRAGKIAFFGFFRTESDALEAVT
jgi:ketosteroid isomerase-like protein